MVWWKVLVFDMHVRVRLREATNLAPRDCNCCRKLCCDSSRLTVSWAGCDDDDDDDAGCWCCVTSRDSRVSGCSVRPLHSSHISLRIHNPHIAVVHFNYVKFAAEYLQAYKLLQLSAKNYQSWLRHFKDKSKKCELASFFWTTLYNNPSLTFLQIGPRLLPFHSLSCSRFILDDNWVFITRDTSSELYAVSALFAALDIVFVFQLTLF